MSDELKPQTSQKPGAESSEPSATISPVPVGIVVLTLVLLFLGMVYFDHHSGWFNPLVYGPYTSAQQLESYQPKSGEAARLAHGKARFDQVCALCHGIDGEGKPGQAPPLAGSQWVDIKSFEPIVHVPLQGLSGPVQVKGKTYSLSMPAMGAAMSDADLADVLTYIRHSWGNKAGPVTEEEVETIRAKIGAHPQALTGEKLKALLK